MINSIYKALASIGYNHPIHPPVTHIPIGLVIGACIFTITALIFKRKSLSQTARHCIVLALLFTPVAVLLGLMDWQHFYGGAWLTHIRIKLILGGSLVIFLMIAWKVSPERKPAFGRQIVAYGLCLAIVTALGFYGGELVYGTKQSVDEVDNSFVQQGFEIFSESCLMCHYTDSRETKIGPGFKGFFQQAQMPNSKKPVSSEAISHQLKIPFERMPAFQDFTEEQIKSLVAYLKTL